MHLRKYFLKVFFTMSGTLYDIARRNILSTVQVIHTSAFHYTVCCITICLIHVQKLSDSMALYHINNNNNNK